MERVKPWAPPSTQYLTRPAPVDTVACDMSLSEMGSMNRRDISTALLALAALPRGTWAQQPGRIDRIGWLDVEPPSPSRPKDPVWVRTLAKLGWVVDKNLVVIYRHTDRMERHLSRSDRSPIGISSTYS